MSFLIKESLHYTFKQLQILIFLFRFRYLNTNQLRILFNHKEPTTVQRWLKNLKDKGLVKQKYDRNKLGENTKPAIYSLTLKARKVLEKQKECDIRALNWIYKQKDNGEKFINECIFLASVYLNLLSQNKGKNKLFFFTKSDLVTYNYFPRSLINAYTVIKGTKKTSRYFLMLLEETAPKYSFEIKVRKLLEYSDEKTWEENSKKHFPAVLIICPNEYVKRDLYKIISDELTKINFYLTTRNAIKFEGLKKEIWEKVI